MSSTSWSMIRSSVGAGMGGFSRSFKRVSQVYAQPFAYLSAKATELARVLVREITAVLRSRGRASFCVSGRIMER